MQLSFTLVLIISFFTAKTQQLIMPGAYPDPSVVKIGATYWATATSSNWFPAFPLVYSKDLVNWKYRGYIFNKKPAWADYYFWAPEINYDSGKVYVYYTAHKKNGALCVAAATADRPEGPYTDLGPLVCQDDGSIDPFAIRDTSGKLYLIWKEDANSVRRPTIIWASEMNEQRTALVGERRELFRNDAPWEKELVEGVSMMHHNNYYYAFYAAAGCCGSRCTYESGVARARDILGPWEKYRRNPILADRGNWLCRGHGTPVEKDGRFYFVYHGYDSATSAFTGREALLQEFRFTANDWIEFVNTPGDSIKRKEILRDAFNEPKLSPIWQWSVFKDIRYQVKDGQLGLFALPGNTGSFIGQKIVSAEYTATTKVIADKSSAYAGLAALGDDRNVVALLLKKDLLRIYKVEDGHDTIVASFKIPLRDAVYLQMRIRGPYRISFLYSLNGKNFIPLNQRPLRGAFLPPWDSPPRAGLIAIGGTRQSAVFDRFEILAGVLNPPDIDSGHTIELAAYVLFAAGLLGLLVFFLRKKRKARWLDGK